LRKLNKVLNYSFRVNFGLKPSFNPKEFKGKATLKFEVNLSIV